MSKKSIAWQNFEKEVFDHFRRKIGAYKFNPRSAKVHQKKGYFSKDRNAEIIFDIAVELFELGAPTFSVLWLIECKDYPTRKVKVDEVEEFWSKMQQVAANKGSIFTRFGFEKGALEYAESKRIGLSVLHKEIEQRIAYAENSRILNVEILRLSKGILTSGHEISKANQLDLDALIQIELLHNS